MLSGVKPLIFQPEAKIFLMDQKRWFYDAIRSITSSSGGQSTQIKYLSKSTDTYTKILLQ